jgi:hypothetical protein
VTSRDQITRLAKPIAPYLGDLDGRARSRKDEGTNVEVCSSNRYLHIGLCLTCGDSH